MEHRQNYSLCFSTGCTQYYLHIIILVTYRAINVEHIQLHRFNCFYLPLRTI
jgi:hypothetical protein